MKIVGFFWLLFLVLGTALMFLTFSSSGNSSFSDVIFSSKGDSVMASASNRKLKEKSYKTNTKKKSDVDNINLDDYHLIDPVPSSKAAIKSGPIEHGTPLMPYIPKPAPPSHPNHGGSPPNPT
ncbi:hypothetical protein HHK36_008303 [Tetracentron sinense]|uniref:Uncharacterized protein n=1 Tax=Tetracentron sinense TaxID=13715 RepID=A0A835DJ79_TETSI|nr:hypothetical protein HHK36_008303 [Tetracentron sinense]